MAEAGSERFSHFLSAFLLVYLYSDSLPIRLHSDHCFLFHPPKSLTYFARVLRAYYDRMEVLSRSGTRHAVAETETAETERDPSRADNVARSGLDILTRFG